MENTQQPQKKLNWIEEEAARIEQESNAKIERRETLTLPPNDITEFVVNYSNEWEKWTDPQTGTIKKIIPVEHGGITKNFWLSTKNPLYKDLILKGKTLAQGVSQLRVKVLRTGLKKDTRYVLK